MSYGETPEENLRCLHIRYQLLREARRPGLPRMLLAAQRRPPGVLQARSHHPELLEPRPPRRVQRALLVRRPLVPIGEQFPGN